MLRAVVKPTSIEQKGVFICTTATRRLYSLPPPIEYRPEVPGEDGFNLIDRAAAPADSREILRKRVGPVFR